MPDIFIASARSILDEAVGDVCSAVKGASYLALNWKPGGYGTNTLAALAAHSMSSTRSWISIAVGAPLPERDRDSEFIASAPSDEALLEFIEAMHADCAALLAEAEDIDWAAMRATHDRPNPDADSKVSAAWALMHALEHLREHAGQMLLTRQLYNDRA